MFFILTSLNGTNNLNVVIVSFLEIDIKFSVLFLGKLSNFITAVDNPRKDFLANSE